MGIPMSVVISPLVSAALFILNDAVNLVVPTPNLLYLAAHLDQTAAWTALPETTRYALGMAALVLPGSLVMLAAWLGAQALFVTAGPEGILSMYRAFGLVMAALGAPFGASSRRTMFRLVRFGFRRAGGAATAAELHEIDEMLSRSVALSDGDLDQLSAKKKTTLADVLRLPFLMAHTAFWMARIAFVSFVIGPLLALQWRARRYLADARAVQLTRNPDGLARALGRSGVRFPAGAGRRPCS